jgi:glycosyltransferase involved in cell wall biosynthesis
MLREDFGGRGWSAVCMRPDFHCSSMRISRLPFRLTSWVRRALFISAARSAIPGALITIDPLLADYMERRAATRRLVYLQDAADVAPVVISRESARAALALPQGRPVLLVYGSIDWRKGVRELLESQITLQEDRQPVIVLAGALTNSIRNWLGADCWKRQVRDGQLLIIDRFTSSNEASMLFSSCDAVWLGYRGHMGSSGVLWQAVAHGRPVIACDEGLIGWLARKYRLGVVIDVSRHESVSRAIADLPKHAVRRSGLEPRSGESFGSELIEAVVRSMTAGAVI